MSHPPAGATRAETPPPDPKNASTGELIGTLTEQISTLVRDEVRLAQGVLTGKYRPGEQPGADTRGGHAEVGGSMKGFLTDEILTAVQGLRPIAEELGLSMAQLAVAWVLQNENVAAAIIGASRPEQVHDNVQAAGVKLDAGVLTRIDEVLGDVVERDPAKTSRG